MFCFFGHEAYGILAPQPGIEPTSPALEGEVLTTGLPGKSFAFFFQIVYEKLLYEKMIGTAAEIILKYVLELSFGK